MITKIYRTVFISEQVEVLWIVTPCHASSIFSLKMEAAKSSETLVSCRNTTRCHNPEDFALNLHHRETLKCRITNNTTLSVMLCRCVGNLRLKQEYASAVYLWVCNTRAVSLETRDSTRVCIFTGNNNANKTFCFVVLYILVPTK
jgi:hypothetical protein